MPVLRIAFFSTRMMLGYGVDLTVHEIALRLVQRHGHSVDVWTPTTDGTYDHAAYRLREIIVHGAPVNRALPLLELNAWTALRKLRSRLDATGERYDVVVPCTHPYYCAGAALGSPQVFFNFGNVPTTGFSWKGKLNWAWLAFSDDFLWKPRSARVASISRFLHEQQGQDVRHHSCVIPLGGDHYACSADPALRAKFRERHGIAADAVVLGYCGRLHRCHPSYKGTGDVMRLGRRLHSVEARVVTVLCGVGSPADEAWVREEGAIPLANVPPEEMGAFYEALDIYVCASRWEGFNLPIVEAAWHGVPAVAYDAGAHGEHVTAVLVPDGRFDELCAAALTLTRDATLRGELSAKAREQAREFSWDHAAARFDAVLREVAR